MALSIFEDKSKLPGNKELAAAIKETYSLWDNIKEFVKKEYPTAIEEWGYSGKNYGWGFRLKDKKRVIIYLTPCDGYFLASLVFGEKATNEALESNLSDRVIDIIKNAKVYAEGRGIRLEIRTIADIPDINKLITIKLKY